MGMILCPHCGTRIFPSADGTCPSCRKKACDAAVIATVVAPSLGPGANRTVQPPEPDSPPPLPAAAFVCQSGGEDLVARAAGGHSPGLRFQRTAYTSRSGFCSSEREREIRDGNHRPRRVSHTYRCRGRPRFHRTLAGF